MSDLPKVKKDADDLTRPVKKGAWRRILASTLGAVAASVALASGATSSSAAVHSAAIGTSAHQRLSPPAKLVLHQVAHQMQTADHYSHASHASHESHMSHASHHSHYSSSD